MLERIARMAIRAAKAMLNHLKAKDIVCPLNCNMKVVVSCNV